MASHTPLQAALLRGGEAATKVDAFGLGLTLFVVTLLLNVIALRIVQKYQEQYD